MKGPTCRHSDPICDDCYEEAIQRAQADAIERERKRTERAQVIGLALDVVPIEWEPQSRRRNNPWSHEWPIPLWLLTADEMEQVPDGTPVFSIMAERATKGVDKIDGDTRGGYLAYGLMDSQLPARTVPA